MAPDQSKLRTPTIATPHSNKPVGLHLDTTGPLAVLGVPAESARLAVNGDAHDGCCHPPEAQTIAATNTSQ